MKKEGDIEDYVSGIAGKIYAKTDLPTILTGLQKINDSTVGLPKKSIDFYNLIEKTYKGKIDTQMDALFKKIKEYSLEYLKAAPKEFDKRIQIFKDNYTKLQALVDDKVSAVSAEDKKKITDFLEASFTDKSLVEVVEILKKFINKHHEDSEIKQAILTLANIDIISRIRGDLEAQNKSENIKDFNNLLKIIDATPDTHEIISGHIGGEKNNNNNKSKKNKKSNKNKTKKRKNSTSKKIKFSKVKKL